MSNGEFYDGEFYDGEFYCGEFYDGEFYCGELSAENCRRRIVDGELSGCRSNVWKHIQRLGHQVRYVEESEFGLCLRMLSALAFLPPQNVISGFEELCDDVRTNYQDDVDEHFEYFEDTYIGRYRRNAPRCQPLFAIDIWNMYHRTDEELPRTNNSVEGWHRSFQRHVSAYH